jgi:predicted nucleotidyltransferase
LVYSPGEEIIVHSLLHTRKSEVELACRRFGVERLEIFGSAADGVLDNDASDLDFLVTFTDKARLRAFDNYFGLLECLQQIFGRSVDLVTARSLKNPYLVREIEKQRQLVYGP